MYDIWLSEAMDLDPDPLSGAAITRLTTATTININIYCEQPYGTPDGRRIGVMRSLSADPRLPPFDLWVADLHTKRMRCLDRGAAGFFVGTAAWSGLIYYVDRDFRLARVNLATCEKQIVISDWPLPPDFVLQSVSPDQRYLVGVQHSPQFRSQIVRVDLTNGAREVIYEHQEVLGHLQFNPVHGRDILVQHNRGMAIDHMHNVRQVPGPHAGSATHFLIDVDGGNHRPLPIGDPHTASSAGHSAWMADTGCLCIASHWRDMHCYKPIGGLDPRHPQGNLFVVHPDWDQPRVIPAPEHRFNHVAVSRCGNYFVCDSYGQGIPGPIAIVVGNLNTGRYRTLLPNCGSSGGGAACTHPHAYLTADNRHVIYNADPYHVPHVWAARLPDDFLAGLD